VREHQALDEDLVLVEGIFQLVTGHASENSRARLEQASTPWHLASRQSPEPPHFDRSATTIGGSGLSLRSISHRRFDTPPRRIHDRGTLKFRDHAHSDNLSAATHELSSGGRVLNERWAAVLKHYDTKSTRISPGNSNENGGVEQRHYRTKSAIAQALVLRGSRDFDSADEYLAFARGVVDKSHNKKVAHLLDIERKHLQPLPSSKVPEFTTWTPAVRCWSTISVNKRIYSVPSRLIGYQVQARQHADVVEVFFKGRLVQTMPRLRGEQPARIDYHHVIWSLVKKPGAFARYRYREELFPTLAFRRAYDALRSSHGDRADVEYVRVLHLAASTMESAVAAALVELLAEGKRFDYATVKARVKPETPSIPEMAPLKPDLTIYDGLFAGGGAA
jgi:hypothetical protein